MSRLGARIRLLAAIAVGAATLGVDALRFRKRNRTREASAFALRWMHGVTNGHLALALARVVRDSRELVLPQEMVSTLAPRSEWCSIAAKAVPDLRSDGIAVLPVRLTPETCSDLVSFARDAPASASDAGGARERTTYRDAAGIWSAFDIDAGVVLDNARVQTLLADPLLLSIAAEYLSTAPILERPIMRWSTRATGRPSSYSGQLFHWDLDSVRFVKVFVYLTDVSTQTGPHVFVRGSHRPDRAGRSLRHRGPRRFSDQDVLHAYGPDDLLEVTGPAGTIFFADTKGFHKGIEPQSSDRLMLQFEYLATTFGCVVPPVRIRHQSSPLAALRATSPATCSRLVLDSQRPIVPG